MKKEIQILMLVFSIIYSENTIGCEIKSINPSGVSPGDTTYIQIISDFVSCGDFKKAGFIDYTNNMDTLYFDEFEIINDSTATVLITVPQNMTYNQTEFFICNEHYWDNRLDTWLTIGSPTTVFKPEICMVTVDSFGKNMVIWSHPEIENIDSTIIYKETSSLNEFMTIGTVKTDRLYFIDTLSEPVQNSNRYKIKMIDISSNETLISDIHKTIHLTISAGIGGVWNLSWDNYEGFNYGTYHIYRGTSDNNLVKIADQASNIHSYTDINPPIETVYYQIEVVNPNPCNIINLKSSKTNYISTRSNIVNSNQINSVDDISLEVIEFYPNPLKDRLYIKSIRNNYYLDFQILSIDGKILIQKHMESPNTEIDISNLKSGIYLFRLSNYNKSIITKLIKK
jgi:hypothetical protein